MVRSMAARPTGGREDGRTGLASPCPSFRLPVFPTSGATATIQLLRPPATQPSSSSAPGVTVSTTSRRTSPLAWRGSSTCSQIATRYPCPTSCLRYSVAAFTGTPARGTPSPREVRAMLSTREASSASSKNIS